MPAPTLSHLICITALLVLIFSVQVFFSYVVDNVWVEMAKRELKEIADYVADTMANLYFLANSTNYPSVALQKTLNLPLEVEGLFYSIQVTGDARNVNAYFIDKTWISIDSWLPPGLTVDQAKNERIESSGRTVVAACNRTAAATYVWMAYV